MTALLRAPTREYHQLGLKPESFVVYAADGSSFSPPPPPPTTPPDPRDFFLGWMAQAEAGGGPGGLPYCEFENTYWSERGRDNLLLVHCADVKADLAGEMRRKLSPSAALWLEHGRHAAGDPRTLPD